MADDNTDYSPSQDPNSVMPLPPGTVTNMLAQNMFPNPWYRFLAGMGAYHPVAAAQNALGLATSADERQNQMYLNRINYEAAKMNGMQQGGPPLGGGPPPVAPQIAPQAAAPGQNMLGGGGGGGVSVGGAPQLHALAQSAAAQFGLPPKLVEGVIGAESGWNPNAVSPKGAQGLMQLMPGTARDLGVTDAFNPEQNLLGGTAYLSQQMQRFGNDIPKALGAYIAGPEAVAQAVQAGGEDWINHLPPGKIGPTKAYIADVERRMQGADFPEPYKGGMMGGGGLAGGQPNMSQMTASTDPRFVPQAPDQTQAPGQAQAPPTQFPAPIGGIQNESGWSGWRNHVSAEPALRYPAAWLAASPQLLQQVKVEEAQQEAYGAAFNASLEQGMAKWSRMNLDDATKQKMKNDWIDRQLAPMLFDAKTGNLKDPRMGDAARKLAIARDADISGPPNKYSVTAKITPTLIRAMERYGLPPDMIQLAQENPGKEATWGNDPKTGPGLAIVEPKGAEEKNQTKEQLTNIWLHDPDPVKSKQAKENLDAIEQSEIRVAGAKTGATEKAKREVAQTDPNAFANWPEDRKKTQYEIALHGGKPPQFAWRDAESRNAYSAGYAQYVIDKYQEQGGAKSETEKAIFSSDKDSLDSITKGMDMIKAFEVGADQSLDLLAETADRYDRGEYPKANEWKQIFAYYTGDKDIRAFQNVLVTSATEYVKVINAGPTPTAAELSVMGQQRAKEMIAAADTPEQLKNEIDKMRQEMAISSNKLTQQRESIVNRMETGVRGGSSTDAASKVDWMERAKAANPAYSEDQLEEMWKRKNGGK